MVATASRPFMMPSRLMTPLHDEDQPTNPVCGAGNDGEAQSPSGQADAGEQRQRDAELTSKDADHGQRRQTGHGAATDAERGHPTVPPVRARHR
jgi:hypothetical protein